MKKPQIEAKKPVGIGGKRVKLPKPVKPGMQRPRFDSLFKPAIDNPLDALPGFDTEPMMSAEFAATREVSEALRAVLEERRERRDEFRIATDTQYYVVLCFQCEDQKKEFLTAMGWLRWGERFLNGLDCARSLGVDISPIDLPMRVNKKVVPVLLRKQEMIK